MSIICKDVPTSDQVQKSAYRGVNQFILVTRSERPKDIKMAEKWCMEPNYAPWFYREISDRVDNMDVRPDDVWLVSFPKCGTTWLQEMVWLIVNNLDYKTASEKQIYKRTIFPEYGSVMSRDLNVDDEVSRAETMSSPRIFKCHLAAHILPRKIWTVRAKIIYLTRNVKDVAVSYYYHYRNFRRYPGSYDDFMEAFLNNHICYTPFHSHVIDFWNMKNEENILFLTYEDMKSDHAREIRKTAKFLEKSITEEAISKLVDHLSFEKFSENKSVNIEDLLGEIEKSFNSKMPDEGYKFVRRGKVGGFRDEMKLELIVRFNEWTEKECEKWKVDDELKKFFLFSQE